MMAEPAAAQPWMESDRAQPGETGELVSGDAPDERMAADDSLMNESQSWQDRPVLRQAMLLADDSLDLPMVEEPDMSLE